MKDTARVALSRAEAVAVHDATAHAFDAEYEPVRRDEFATPFGYGRSKLDALLAEEVGKLDPTSVVLDVGCGTGEQIKSFRAIGLKPIGVEPAAAMREIAMRMNPGVQIVD